MPTRPADGDWEPWDGYADPRDDDTLPWVEHPTDDDLKTWARLAPPPGRLAAEPAEVEVADNGQNLLLPEEFQPPAEEMDPGGARKRVAPGVGGISLTDYSRSPSARGWGTACQVPLAAVQLTNLRVMTHAAHAELVGLIMRSNEHQGYLYRAKDTGCYNCRNIGGTSQKSWHSWAVAVDSNWQSNPMRKPLTTDRPRWELDRWNRFGYAWGGDYTGGTPPDTMHTEALFHTNQIGALLDLARRELLPILGGMPAPTPRPPSSADSAEQIRKDQANLLDTGFDCRGTWGVWDPNSQAAAKRFQFAARLTVDGDMGPATRGALAKVPSWRTAPDRAGDGGHSALAWQRKLKEHGWRIETDGVWAAHSAAILGQFQADKGLPRDGLRGPQCWTTLHTTVN
jgi:hypothetical protein